MTYSLTGTDALAFTVNSSTGVVTINNTPDFETRSSYSFNVRASDPSGLFDTQAVTININDLASVISSGSAASVNEGVSANTTVYTAVAADPAGGAVTYSLTGTDASAFSVNSSTGVVTINNPPDFETRSSYSFNVRASDPSGLFDTQAVTININDLAPVISSGSAASVNEGVSANATVYTAVAVDPAGGAVTYSLSGTDASAFNVDALTGVVTIVGIPDFETRNSYSINVNASDASGAFDAKAVTINVNDLNDAPVISTANVQMTAGPGGQVTFSGISVSDADPADTFTYDAEAASGHSVTGSGAGTLSAINATLNNGIVYDPGITPPTDNVTLNVTDASGATDAVNFIFQSANPAPNEPVTLAGTSAKDVLFATGNQDQFDFAADSGHDTIIGFAAGDQINLSALSFVNAGNIGDFLTSNGSGDTLITLDSDDIILVRNVPSLQASDFILHA